MTRESRRSFLKRAAATAGVAAGLTIAGTKASGRVLGANEAIRAAVAGINSRGQNHIEGLLAIDGVQVTYLVDPDSRLFPSRAKAVKERGKNTPKCVQDIRSALDDQELDVVSVAATNHWHSLLTYWACEAKKDVYVEKPLSHNPFEGRQCVEIARRNKCVVQHGTQYRSESGWAKQVAAVASGKYGKLLISYGYASKPRRSIGFAQPEDPPKGLDFNLWLGPAPEQPYHRNLVHYNWHWFWDFGNGEIGNQGVHQMDIARWAITAATGKTGPRTVVSLGGRFGYQDQAQTPNTQLTIFDFGDGTRLFFEDYGLVSGRTQHVDNEFHLEGGVIRGGKFYPRGSDKAEPLGEVQYTCHGGGPFGNFIDCVRSRKREELNADVLEGHLSAMLCHLGNASYRLGEQAPFSKTPQSLSDDEDSVAAYQRMKKHLAEHTDMNLDESQYCLGRKLAFNPDTEQFVGDPEANRLLTRPYRNPFVVPTSLRSVS